MLNWVNITSTCHNMFIVRNNKNSHIKFYYHVLILIELYFNNFNYFSNFRPLTCFSVMIPETV
jgi:hypothetical protein